MHDRKLGRMRELIRTSNYVMTLHAQDEMEADGFTIFDVEHCVLTGGIVARQKEQGTAEWKYLVRGQTIEGERAVVVAKFGSTGKLVIITVFREEA